MFEAQRKALRRLLWITTGTLVAFAAIARTTSLGTRISEVSVARSHTWFLEVSTEPRAVEHNITLVTRPIERALRTVDGLRDVTNVTHKNKVIFAFHTGPDKHPGRLEKVLREKVARVNEGIARTFGHFDLIYKDMRTPFDAQEPASLSSDSASLRFSQDLHYLFGARGPEHPRVDAQQSVLRHAPRGLSLSVVPGRLSMEDHVRAIRETRAFLSEMRTEAGVLAAFALDATLPVAHVRLDAPRLSAHGLTPEAVFNQSSLALRPALGAGLTFLGRPHVTSEAMPSSLTQLEDIRIASDSAQGQRLGDVADITLAQAMFDVLRPDESIADALRGSRARISTEPGGQRTPMRLVFVGRPEVDARALLDSVKERIEAYPTLNRLTDDMHGAHWRMQSPPGGLASPWTLALNLGVICAVLFALASALRIRSGLAYAVHATLAFASGIFIFSIDARPALIALFATSGIAHILLVLARTQDGSETLGLVARSLFAHLPGFLTFSIAACVFAHGVLAPQEGRLQPMAILDLGLALLAPSYASLSFAHHVAHPVPRLRKRRIASTHAEPSVSLRTTWTRLLALALVGILGAWLHADSGTSPRMGDPMSGTLMFTGGIAPKQILEVSERLRDATRSSGHGLDIVGAQTGHAIVLRPQGTTSGKVELDHVDAFLIGLQPQSMGFLSGVGASSEGLDVVASQPDASGGLARTHRWAQTLAHTGLPLSVELEEPTHRAVRAQETPAMHINFLTLESARRDAYDPTKAIDAALGGSSERFRFVLHTHAGFVSDARARHVAFLVLVAFFMFFVAAVYFSSTHRAALAALTFLVFACVGEAATAALGMLSPGVEPHTVIPEELRIGMALLATAFWAVLARTADLMRAQNKSLSDAFAPTIATCRVVSWGIGGAAACAGALAARNGAMREWAISLSLLVFCIGWISPFWMQGWAAIAEARHRFELRLAIRKRQGGMMRFLIPFIVLGVLAAGALAPTPARADLSGRSLDARCETTAIAVLPIVGRPKGKEPAPQRAIFTERLAQETPCSWIDASLQGRIVDLIQNARGSGQQRRLISDITRLVNGERARIETETRQRFPDRAKALETRIYAGFYEEFFGNIAFTVFEVNAQGRDPVPAKLTVAEINATDGIAQLARYLRGERLKLFEGILGESERLPVLLEGVESLDKHPLSENLAQEIDLFLRSRLTFPFQTSVFDRKTFFRVHDDAAQARHRVAVRIRREGTRFYASIATVSAESEKRRTAWVEGDVSQLPHFEEEVLAAVQKCLADSEGITDYALALGADFLIQRKESFRMFGLVFRQNLGNAATSFRLRTGSRVSEAPGLAGVRQSMLSLGATGGWQFTDLRWMVADLGLGADLGLLTSSVAGETSKRTILASYGPHVQFQFNPHGHFVVFTRMGVEQLQPFNDQNLLGEKPKSFYANAVLGAGISF